MSVPKTPPMAEIVFFPNAKQVIAGVPEAQIDTHTKTRWLKLAMRYSRAATSVRRRDELVFRWLDSVSRTRDFKLG